MQKQTFNEPENSAQINQRKQHSISNKTKFHIMYVNIDIKKRIGNLE